MNSSKEVKNSITPVIFHNTPISDEKDDIFGFKEQVNILDNVIESGSTLIGIIGDYGSGKSSLTENCQKKLCEKYGQAIRINMWDTIKQGGEDHNFSFIIRSFLYQLAQGNGKNNINFARYINERQSRNFGKLSLTMASRWALLWFSLAGLLLIIYFTLVNNDLFSFLIDFLKENKLCAFLSFMTSLKLFSYLILFCGLIFIYLGIKTGNFVFSLWDSQGKMKPEYGDIFDNYIQIINRLTGFRKSQKKAIIYIEDLDRIDDKKFIIPFLQELHRLINILPIEQKGKIAFIVSLKSESSLKKELKDNAPKDDKSIYSKIFDYTLWIKPIHSDNISDVVWELLYQNQVSIRGILNINEKIELPKTLLHALFWIQKDENLTIREIKDRLNETFILYQTLRARDFENSSVNLRKCCAVTYLHRAYSDEYEELIKNEQKIAEIIRECCQWQKSDGTSIVEKITVVVNELFDNNPKEIFIIDLAQMIFDADIDEDFLMYFYNYPISSYIKNIDEKEVFDYIIHPSDGFKSDDRLSEKIERIIANKKGKIIKEAIDELKEREQNIPDIVFENERLFSFVFQHSKNFIISTLDDVSKEFISPTKICHFFEIILSYSIEEDQKAEIIFSIISTLYASLQNFKPENIILFRITLINSVKSYIIHFSKLFVDDKMPIISKQELQLLDTIEKKLSLINCSLIDKNNYIYFFDEINDLDLNESQYIKAEKLLENIEDIDELPNIHKYLLAFLSKNKKYEAGALAIVLEKIVDTDDKLALCAYLDLIDISLLTAEELIELDKMRLKYIPNEKIILHFEKRNLYQSALLSRVALKIIDDFDFIKSNIFSDELDFLKDIYKDFPEEFLAIRFSAFKQLHDKDTKLYELFSPEFPLISDNEIELVNDTDHELFKYLNHLTIDKTNYQLLTNYCNKKMLGGDKLYYFFDSLFFDEAIKISNVDHIKLIISGIDFKNIIHFESMSSEQQERICKEFSNVYKLTTAIGSIEFIKVVNCLIPELEKIVDNNLKNEGLIFSNYIDLINDIKKPTEETVKIIRTKSIKQALDSTITDKLYKKHYYIQYLIGKTLKDNIMPIDENIPLEKYYQAFYISDKFAEYCSTNEDVLMKFVKNKLLNESLSNSRLIFFYKLRQPLFLIEFILERLQDNIEETKKYLYSIKDIDTEEDADKFIGLITSEKYVELLRDEHLFYYIHHKMWNRGMKQKLTFLANKIPKISQKYTRKEAGDFDENNEQSEQEAAT
jgi:hypothetical protein